MHGLKKDSYLVKSVAKWVTAITDAEDKKIR